MEFANRKFRNNKTGEIVKVIDTFENIAILENKQKVDVRQLSDPLHWTEEIDPSMFFNTQGAYNSLADKIKSLPTHLMQDDPEEIVTKFGGDLNPSINESAIVMTTEEDEMAELARKYGVEMDNTTQLANQQNAFAQLLGEDAEDLPVIKNRPQEPITRIEVDREVPVQQTTQQENPTKTQYVDDPIITMFKKAKRNVELSTNITINNKIPRLDFIEMMEDSYETSIIDFLADEFTKEIINNPETIKETIKSKIREVVYGIESIPTPVNPQIKDEATQAYKDNVSFDEKTVDVKVEKPKTTRRSRAKKENINND